MKIYDSTTFKDNHPDQFYSFIQTMKNGPCIPAIWLAWLLENWSDKYNPLRSTVPSLNHVKDSLLQVITEKWLWWLKDGLHIFFGLSWKVDNLIEIWNNDDAHDELHKEFCISIAEVLKTSNQDISFTIEKERLSAISNNTKEDLFMLIFSPTSNWKWRKLVFLEETLYGCLIIQPYSVFDKQKFINSKWEYEDHPSLSTLRDKIRKHPNNWDPIKCPYHKFLKLLWVKNQQKNSKMSNITIANYPWQMPLPGELTEANIPNQWSNWQQYAYAIQPWMTLTQIEETIKKWPIKVPIQDLYPNQHETIIDALSETITSH